MYEKERMENKNKEYLAHKGSIAQYLQIIKATWEQYKAIKPFDKTMGNSVELHLASIFNVASMNDSVVFY